MARSAGLGPATGLASIRDASLVLAFRRSRCVRRVLAPVVRPPFVAAPLVVQECPTTRTPPLFGEQGVERGRRVDLASALQAREPRHPRIVAEPSPVAGPRRSAR